MIDFDSALALVLEHCTVTGTRTVPLAEAAGSVLAEDVTAKNDIPPFDSSSVDGYALRARDSAGAGAGRAVKFAVAGVVHAGEVPAAAAGRLCAVKIMTGAPMPENADAVVMKEHVTNTVEGIELTSGVPRGSHIRRRGAEFREGAIVLHRGTLITPPVAGLLATAGRARVRVYGQPRISVILTGSELRSPGAELKPGQVRDSNSAAFTSALRMLGIQTVTVSRAADRPARVFDAVGAALRSADIVITVGGISVGDRDYVREAMQAHEVSEHFWRVAMKPGKPNYFGTRAGTLVFGLPGNPVSALLSFYLLVRPAIARIMGMTVRDPLVVHARLEGDLKKEAGRMEFVRMRLSGDGKGGFTAEPLRGQESHMLSGLSAANGLYRFPKKETVKAGGRNIPVELIEWGWS